MLFTVGVDVGNSRTKSAHTEFISGYTQYEHEQLLANKCLCYNGKYYAETLDSPFPYVEDKRENNQCLILTLISIAREIIWRIKDSGRCANQEMMQEEIKKYDKLNLAVGLPPGHFTQAQDMKEFYLKALEGTTTFKYGKYEFSFTTNKVAIYAQGLSAAVVSTDVNKNLAIPRNNAKYYVFDIGGYTFDMIPIIAGEPDSANIHSEPLGVRPICEKIAGHIQTTMGHTYDEYIIENVIREGQNKNTVTYVPEDVKKEILNYAQMYANRLVDKAIQCGFTVNYNPVLYVGGGSMLLKPFLQNNKKVGYAEWIESSNANAIAYEEYMKRVAA